MKKEYELSKGGIVVITRIPIEEDRHYTSFIGKIGKIIDAELGNKNLDKSCVVEKLDLAVILEINNIPSGLTLYGKPRNIANEQVDRDLWQPVDGLEEAIEVIQTLQSPRKDQNSLVNRAKIDYVLLEKVTERPSIACFREVHYGSCPAKRTPKYKSEMIL